METSEISGSERGGIITARGTGEGLVIRLDGRVGEETLKTALLEFMAARKGFLSGNEVALEWVSEIPAETFVAALSEMLSADYGIGVKESRLWEPTTQTILGEALRAEDAPPSLFDGIDALQPDNVSSIKEGRNVAASKVAVSKADQILPEKSSAVGAALWDEADARMVYSTMRSGQRVETEHSLVVFGDVNSGAELVAGGDIIVLGTLRGVAHAGAYEESGGGRVIFALNLAPTQLRIGTVISRGAAPTQRVPEVARVEGNAIVVEPYQARPIIVRRR